MTAGTPGPRPGRPRRRVAREALPEPFSSASCPPPRPGYPLRGVKPSQKGHSRPAGPSLQAKRPSQYRCLTCPLGFGASARPADFVPVDPAAPAGLCGACARRVQFVRAGAGAPGGAAAGQAEPSGGKGPKRAASLAAAFRCGPWSEASTPRALAPPLSRLPASRQAPIPDRLTDCRKYWARIQEEFPAALRACALAGDAPGARSPAARRRNTRPLGQWAGRRSAHRAS